MRRHLPLFILVASVGSATAQQPARVPATDSVLVEKLGSLAINEYSFLIARSVFDTTTRPFDLQLPTEDPQGLWSAFGRKYLAIHNGRTYDRVNDHSVWLMHIEHISVRGDTFQAHLGTGVARHCAASWMEDRRVDLVTFVQRVPGYWMLASRTPVLYSESFGRCPEDLSRRDSMP